MESKKLKKDTIDKIKGLDLLIDSSIQDICNTSNATSSNTRSVMYTIMIVIILGWVGFFNTHKFNWTKQRIESSEKEIIELEKIKNAYKKHLVGKNDSRHVFFANNDSIIYSKDSIQQFYEDSISNAIKLEFEKKKHDKLVENKIFNIQTMNIPLFGYSFDVNNLGTIIGIAFIFLLGILRFSIKREISNLIIAMNAITDRYSYYSNATDFSHFLNSLDKEEEKGALTSINYIRRKYHYNHLSMNEIFNLPPLKIAGVELENSKNEERLAQWIFWFPALSYFLVLLNDATTIVEGIKVNPVHTIVTFTVTLICFILIYALCKICYLQKKRLMSIFTEFKENNYMLKKEYVEEMGEANE